MDWPPDLLPYVLFTIAMAVTPGPNNIMISTGAANHGVRATVPHMLGVNLGFCAMMLIVGWGLAGPLATLPALHAVLRWVGIAWLLWIAWTMVQPVPAGSATTAAPAAPMRFLPAALFQWVNPKAWAIALAATTTYTSADRSLPQQVLVLALLSLAVGAPCTLLWSMLGAGAGRILHSPRQFRVFNAVMAGLLVLSVVPLLVG